MSKYVKNGILTEAAITALTEAATSANFKKIAATHINNVRNIEETLSKHGVNVKQLKQEAKPMSKKILAEIKIAKGTDPKSASTKVMDMIEKEARVLQKKFEKQIKTPSTEGGDTLAINLAKSLGLLLLATIIQQFCMGFVEGIFKGFQQERGISINEDDNKLKSVMLVSIIVAPLTEEFAKRIAIKDDFGWTFGFVFTGVETAGAIHKGVTAFGVKGSKNISRLVFLRLLAVVMHFTTIFVQKLFGKDSKNGFYIAVLIHAVYNATAFLFGKQIAGFLGVTD